MKPVQRNRRLGIIAGTALLLAGAVYLVLGALERNITYFYEPSELLALPLHPGTYVRLGGLVESGSVKTAGTYKTVFRVTDGTATIPVYYEGILPDLFREGQGVIARGYMVRPDRFVAESILAKHDENYMPRELEHLSPEQGARTR